MQAADLLKAEQDFLYEEQVLRDPHHAKAWVHYLEAKKDSPPKIRFLIYERAVQALPGSYKLWYHYLQERLRLIRGLPVKHPLVEDTNNAFQRALVFLHKMPTIWVMALTFLSKQPLITYTRHMFDRALQALPVTQHDRIWPLYITWIKHIDVPETAVRVYRRFLMYDPTQAEDYVTFLKSVNRWDEAAKILANLVNDDNFTSLHNKSKHELWAELCELLVKHADRIYSLDVDAIIRGGIRKYSQEIGRLWCFLAEYYIRLGHFAKARDVYEESLSSVMTVRDFTLCFEGYSRFEESMVSAIMPNEENELAEEDEDADEQLEDASTDIDLGLLRLERLTIRRPLLLNSVLLRQNPHNAAEWLNRVKLYKPEQAEDILKTYAQAVTTVDPQKATGPPQALWIEYAKFYESHEDLDNARVVFQKATQANFRQVAQLATVWCEWAEMELRHKNYEGALQVMRDATDQGRVSKSTIREDDTTIPVQQRLYKSLKLWSLYVDLEESLGTLESTKAVYERILEHRIATPQMILNYASLMEENKFFEDSFRVYERGVALFPFPAVMPIWTTYLSKFVARYAGSKAERARELFEMAVEKVPEKDAKTLYLLYAKFEEDYGLARRAMLVYDRACRHCGAEDKFELYNLYLRRASESFGITRTREIYQKALESLPDAQLKTICLQFAQMEKSLGEIDRARAIFVYGSQFCDPEAANDFWTTWEQFEVDHGNLETFREMWRIKRTVASTFASSNFVANASAAAKAANQQSDQGIISVNPSTSSASVGQKRKEMSSETEDKVVTKKPAVSSSVNVASIAAASSNPDEIDIDMTDSAPAAAASKTGAMDRFKAARGQ